MPNITIYLSDDMYARFRAAETKIKKAAKENAIKAIEKTLQRGE